MLLAHQWNAGLGDMDAHSTGDPEVVGSIPVGRQRSFLEIVKYFLRSFSLFRWFKMGSCQFLAKECAQYMYWLTA